MLKEENYPCNRLWMPIVLWAIKALLFSKQLAHGVEVVSLMCRPPPPPPKTTPGIHFC
jgi:hypothetical protein